MLEEELALQLARYLEEGRRKKVWNNAKKIALTSLTSSFTWYSIWSQPCQQFFSLGIHVFFGRTFILAWFVLSLRLQWWEEARDTLITPQKCILDRFVSHSQQIRRRINDGSCCKLYLICAVGSSSILHYISIMYLCYLINAIIKDNWNYLASCNMKRHAYFFNREC